MKLPRLFPLLFFILIGAWMGHLLRAEHPPGEALTYQKTVPSTAGPLIPAGQNKAGGPVHPESDLLGWMRQALESVETGGHGFDAAIDAPQLLLTLERLTPDDFPLLLGLLAERADGKAKGLLQEWLLTEWSQRSPYEALLWARDNREDKYGKALEVLSKRNAAAAWREFEVHSVKLDASGNPVRSIFSEWARQDRKTALDALFALQQRKESNSDRLGSGAELGFFSSALPTRTESPEQWRETRDDIARQILEQKDEDVRFHALNSLLSQMNSSYGHTADPVRLAIKRRELAEWLLPLPLTEAEQARHLSLIAQWDGSEIAPAVDAFPWFWQTVPASQRVNALASIVEYWASNDLGSAQDPDACGRWLNGLGPLGPEFSIPLKSFALHAAAKDPESGLAWARQIADPAVRGEAVAEVGALILKQWPHRAAELGVVP